MKHIIFYIIYLFNCSLEVLIKLMLQKTKTKSWFSYIYIKKSWFYHVDPMISFNLCFTWNLVRAESGKRGGLQFQKPRVPGLIEVMQFAKPPSPEWTPAMVCACGCACGSGPWNATLTFLVTRSFSQGSFHPRWSLRNFPFLCPLPFLSSLLFSPQGKGEGLFQYIRFSQLSSPGDCLAFIKCFSFILFHCKTMVMGSETLNGNRCPPESHFCRVSVEQGEVNSTGWLQAVMICVQDVPARSVIKDHPVKAGDTGSIPSLGRSHMPWGQLSRSAATAEACAPKARAQLQEKPPQWEASTPQLERSPCSPQLEKARVQQWRLSATKTKNWKIIRLEWNSDLRKSVPKFHLYN